MTAPAFPNPISAEDIYYQFAPPINEFGGSASGTAPNWTITGFGTPSGDTTNIIGRKIRTPEGAATRIGEVTGYTVSPEAYGASTFTLNFTMEGTTPPAATAFLTDFIKGPRYSTVAPRTNNLALGSAYAGGGFVPAGSFGFPNGPTRTAIPTTGAISYSNFRGSPRPETFSMTVTDPNQLGQIILPPGTWYLNFNLVGGGGGGGGADDGPQIGSPGGQGGNTIGRIRLTTTTTGRLNIYCGGPGGAGASDATAPAVTNGGASGAAIHNAMGGIYNAFLVGGNGGSAGNYGSSGCGGGGGGCSAIGWVPDTVAGTEYFISIAGGGGGGTGAGYYSITTTPGTVSLANQRNRYSSYSLSTVMTFDQQYDIFTPFPGWIGGSAYRRAGRNSDGQGMNTMTNYYPPADEPWTGGYDGGGGGGGGGGNGWGGGLCRSADGLRVWVQYTDYYGTAIWYPPHEFCGEGGSQGYNFFNYNSAHSSMGWLTNNYSTVRSYIPGYSYGAGGPSAGNGTNGVAAVTVTNDPNNTSIPLYN